MEASRRRILFVAEDVTLAQVVRLAALAERLDPSRYEVHFACREFAPLIFSRSTAHQWPLYTVEREAALKRLAKGERMYDEKTLLRYVEEELALFDRVQPDLVVGDFRLSLTVSAPHRGIPLATLINAYWSPYAERDAFPVPDHPIVSLIGAERAARYLPQALPKAFAYFAAPLSAVRRKFGLLPIEDLLEQLTFGDLTLYPDVPELCPIRNAPEHHVYLGPIPWAPSGPLPKFWDTLRQDVPVVYVTLGSSGDVSAVPAVIEGLSELPVEVLLSSAGRARPDRLPSNMRVVAEYLPGDLAARRSTLVITNGGSGSSYQALAEGVPVVGVAFNMDQYLSMTAIAAAGAGILVRSGTVNAREVKKAVVQILNNRGFSEAAGRIRERFAAYDCFRRFEDVLSRVFTRSTAASGGTTLSA